MVIVVIVLCVIAIVCSLFKVLGLIDFINIKRRKGQKSRDKAGDDTTSNENVLTD